MEVLYTPHFAKQYKKLPKAVVAIAERQDRLFRTDWRSPKLRVHKLKGRFTGSSAFSINPKYRVIFEFIDENTVLFTAIGNHDIYD